MPVRPLLLALLLLLTASGWAQGITMRVKDLGKVQGWRENVLVGTGIVTGLAGTGDSPGNRATRQALSNVLSQFNLGVAKRGTGWPLTSTVSANIAAGRTHRPVAL